MPYIEQERRDALVAGSLPRCKGEVNYLACIAVVYYLDYLRLNKKKTDYESISEAIDALLDAAAELRRRLLEPYEDKVKERNGDIFPEWLLERVRGFSTS